jgi:hypothetical protein
VLQLIVERKDYQATHDVDNFPLQSSYLISANKRISDATATSLGFKVNTVGQTNIFTLPYSTANLAFTNISK